MNEDAHDPGRYRLCMQELVQRLGLFDTAIRPFAHKGTISIANCELAALQLRKMYELVGFASISANKRRYAEIRTRFERDWNLGEILNRIEKVNPQFLPISLVEKWGDGTNRSPHSISQGVAKFEKQSLLEHHGRLGEILHARNPYAKPINYRYWHDWMLERCRELIAVMECHAVMIEYQKTMYRVALRDADTNDVMVVIMNFELAP